jgi:hypothetical protein
MESPSRRIETLFQKKAGYLSMISASDEYPSCLFIPISEANGASEANPYRARVAYLSRPIKTCKFEPREKLKQVDEPVA